MPPDKAQSSKGIFSASEKFWGFAQPETDDSISFVLLLEWEAHKRSLESPERQLPPTLHLNPTFHSLRKLTFFLNASSP